MTFRVAIENVGKGVDVLGVATLVVASWTAARAPRDGTVDRYRVYRQRLGNSILLGLEVELEGRWPRARTPDGGHIQKRLS